jgi:hypothetical protein
LQNESADNNFVIIAAAQDTGGIAAAAPWYEKAEASFVSLVDESHTISSLYNLVNVPSAVWIDEEGFVRRIDEGAYSTANEFGGRAEYAPMVSDWVRQGDDSAHVLPRGELKLASRTADEARAEPMFKLGVYFHQAGDAAKADKYWAEAQQLNPASWNYHRQDWSFTPEEAGANWMKKYQSLQGKPYYKPIDGLDGSD